MNYELTTGQIAILAILSIVLIIAGFSLIFSGCSEDSHLELEPSPSDSGHVAAAPKAKLRNSKPHSHGGLIHHSHDYTNWKRHKKDSHAGIMTKEALSDELGYAYQGGSGNTGTVSITHRHDLYPDHDHTFNIATPSASQWAAQPGNGYTKNRGYIYRTNVATGGHAGRSPVWAYFYQWRWYSQTHAGQSNYNHSDVDEIDLNHPATDKLDHHKAWVKSWGDQHPGRTNPYTQSKWYGYYKDLNGTVYYVIIDEKKTLPQNKINEGWVYIVDGHGNRPAWTWLQVCAVLENVSGTPERASDDAPF